MFRFYIDTSDIRRNIRNFEKIEEIAVLKEVNWYLNQVYGYLAKKHGTRYSYITPPGRERLNLRIRSRRLLNTLRDSRFTEQRGDTYVAGFSIPEGNPKGNYLGVHVGEDESTPPFKLTPNNAKHTFSYKDSQRILIPLRAALNSDGTVKGITPRHAGAYKVMPFAVAKTLSPFTGENKSKFHDGTLIVYKTSGRRIIPMYILARKASIPRRILLAPAMEKYLDKFYARIDTQIERELNRVQTKRHT